MHRVVTIAALLLTTAIGLPSAQNPGSSTPPLNVVLLIIDDTRWDAIGAAGNRIVRTPRIDQLASEGVRFAQARVTTSICMVSRATLLTGQYMSRHGITAFGRPIAQTRSRTRIPACSGAPATGPGMSASTASARRGQATSTSSARTKAPIG